MKFFSFPVVVSICVSIALVGIAIAMQGGASTQNMVVQNAPQLKAVLANAQVTDTDTDGLADWEETLWGTDSKNPDSDKDGAKDGEEVKIGRNPTVPGPNDTIETGNNEKTTEPSTSKQKTEPIDLLSRELLQKYLSLKQNGTALTAEDALQIADGISASIEELEPQNSHVPSDFISIDATESAMRTYGNTLGQIFTANFPKDYGQEALIVERALQQQNESEMIKIQASANGYTAIYNKLLAVPVPRNALQIHSEAVSSLKELAANVQALGLVFTDPLKSLQGLKNWQSSTTRVGDAVREISYYFSENDVVFNSTEYGSTFDSGVE